MKRVTLSIDDTTYDLIRQEAVKRGIKIQTLILDYLLIAFPSDVSVCFKCGKVFSIEADEGSLRDEGTFCNKHLPKEREE